MMSRLQSRHAVAFVVAFVATMDVGHVQQRKGRIGVTHDRDATLARSLDERL